MQVFMNIGDMFI